MDVEVGQKVSVGEKPHCNHATVERVLSPEYVIVRWVDLTRPPFMTHVSNLSKPGKIEKLYIPRFRRRKSEWATTYRNQHGLH